MKRGVIGTLSPWGPSWQKMTCQWPGCKDGADTIGKIGKGKIGNVCSKHKAIGDREVRR